MKTSPIVLRRGESSQARTLHALIAANLDEGHLLPRTLAELKTHAPRFVIATRGRRIVELPATTHAMFLARSA